MTWTVERQIVSPFSVPITCRPTTITITITITIIVKVIRAIMTNIRKTHSISISIIFMSLNQQMILKSGRRTHRQVLSLTMNPTRFFCGLHNDHSAWVPMVHFLSFYHLIQTNLTRSPHPTTNNNTITHRIKEWTRKYRSVTNLPFKKQNLICDTMTKNLHLWPIFCWIIWDGTMIHQAQWTRDVKTVPFKTPLILYTTQRQEKNFTNQKPDLDHHPWQILYC